MASGFLARKSEAPLKQVDAGWQGGRDSRFLARKSEAPLKHERNLADSQDALRFPRSKE